MSDSARFRRTGRWLLSHEAQGCESAAGLAEAGARVLEQMEQDLGILVGRRGVRLLVVRALQAAQTEFAFLCAAQGAPETESALAGLVGRVAGLDPALVCDGLAAVVAGALALLSDFVGADLTLRQIRRIWPELPSQEASSHEEVGHEPA